MRGRVAAVDHSQQPNVYREFLHSGVAAVGAICITNPLDVVRTRLQLQGQLETAAVSSRFRRGIGETLRHIAKVEGWRGLQRGLAPACLLQFSNVSMRFGAYNVTKQVFGIRLNDTSTYAQSLAAAGFAGALAALVSNPFFLLKNRFQDTQYQYASLRDGIREIYRSEGWIGYYKGLSAFVPRVIVASAVQLSTYDVIKHSLVKYIHCEPTRMSTHFAASLITGLAVVGCMQPFDFAATRAMSQPQGPGALYTGPVDVIVKTLRTEGIRGIYKGALASYLRFGPYCILVFVFLEQLRTHC